MQDTKEAPVWGTWKSALRGLEKRVALLDVTGLMDAVESPAKPDQPRHWCYEGGDGRLIIL
jgi:hypothetical protein